MNTRLFSITLITAFCLCMETGCTRHAANTGPLTAAAAPKVMEAAFESAPPAVRQEAVAIAQAASQADPDAVNVLLQFMQRPELTPAQRQVTGRCLPVALSGARQAAANGDQRAARILEEYHARK